MTGNTGNAGNTGNTGNTGNAGLAGDFGGGWLTSYRVDLPFVTELEPGGPNELGDLRRANLLMTQFPDRYWAARWYAFKVLHEFTESGWRAPVQGVMDGLWAARQGTANLTNDEIDLLVLANRDERPEAMGEILAQDVEFISDFMSLLTITPGSYRRTYRVLHIASLIGSFAALYFKHRYNRPRPTHFCPALMPPIPVPGHSAYPSGHSTQAHLMALCISAIVNAALAAPDPAVFNANLTVLAQRVARNREIAGLHYQSDSEDGAQLAQQLFNRLNLMAGMGLNSFQDAMNAAVGEW